MTSLTPLAPAQALGSVGSFVVGFAAQSALGNVVSAMGLYTTRPFVPGDRVQFKSLGGSTIVEGARCRTQDRPVLLVTRHCSCTHWPVQQLACSSRGRSTCKFYQLSSPCPL